MSTQTISLEQLAEKLGGNLWVKGDLKRIYLDEGHNTKKMSTKTFVWQDEDGQFKVSCKVECPSQPWQWCKSQEDDIKKSVYRQIESELSDTAFIMTNEAGVPVNSNGKPVGLNESEYFYTEKEALKEIDNCYSYHQ